MNQTELEKQARELVLQLCCCECKLCVAKVTTFAAQVRAQTIEECESIVRQFEGCDGVADLIHSLIGQIRALREREK